MQVNGIFQNRIRRTRYQISFYIFIPVIFSVISIISVITAYRITDYYLHLEAEPTWHLKLWAFAIGIVTYVCGFVVTWIILNPEKRFIKQAENGSAPAKKAAPKMLADADDFEHLNVVFEQTTDLLGKVESKQMFPEIVGQSRMMRGLFSQIMKVAPTDTTVLISGESGTGKELIATSIYNHSLRKGKPFIKLNCVAIPDGLLESELFGHEKGSFTGAISTKQGKFELANGGTIFLDEIADMNLATQAKLLRALQEKEFERVGGTRPIKVDVRFIAATNKNLPKMVKSGQFRNDLFYRLNVFSLYLPPLRDRKEDISLLLDHFVAKTGNNFQISSMALQFLMSYYWPGNVRELKNTIERAALMVESGGILEPGHLPVHILTTQGITGQLPASTPELEKASINDKLRELEKSMIIEAIIRAGGVQVKAAQFLGIKERSLWHRIKKYGIDVSTIKNGAR